MHQAVEKLSKPTRMAANPPILHVFVTAVAKEIQRNVELDLYTIKKKSKHQIIYSTICCIQSKSYENFKRLSRIKKSKRIVNENQQGNISPFAESPLILLKNGEMSRDPNIWSGVKKATAFYSCFCSKPLQVYSTCPF